MEIISEQSLIKLMDETTTKLTNKDFFWLELKKKKDIYNERSLNHHNLIVDIPNKAQRDSFLNKYDKQNPNYDYYANRDNIPNKYKELYKNNHLDFKYSEVGIPLIIADIDSISTIKELYIAILKSIKSCEKDLKIRNLEEMEHRIISLINLLSVEMVAINYSGNKLTSSKKLSSVLYNLCRLSELCKIPFNLFGSISPKVFYSESVKVPVGSFYCIEGENNSKDVHFVTYTIKLNQ